MSPSGPPPGPQVKTLWVRGPYLAHILAGRKTVEVRVGYDNIRRLRPGDLLRLNDRHLAVIRRVDCYADFEELLAREDPAAIAPELPSGELLDALRHIYPPGKEALGAVALEIALRPYDAVLFDMGYTLVGFEPPQEVIVQEVLRSLGAERSTEQILAAARDVWGTYFQDEETTTFPPTREQDARTQRDLETGLLAHLGLDHDDRTWQAYSSRLDDWFGRPGVIHPYPEVPQVLDALRAQGYRLGIVSNWSWNLRQRVAQAGLDGYFELVWASAYAGCNKPHPVIFHQALEQMDLDAGRVIYVGDSYRHDVVGARNAGIEPVLVDRSGQATETNCTVISDLRGVLELVA